MTSQIDVTVPVYGKPTTQSVRSNFATASTEITALQAATTGSPFLPLRGGHMTGPMYLFNDPTDVMMPATKGYVDAHGGGGTGGGGIPEAPSDGALYGRGQGAWQPALPIAGGTMTGPIILPGNPTNPLAAAPKQMVDAVSTVANGAVQIAGSTMTGLLVLSANPTAALGATTKQYTDAADALKAPIASPTFTGTVTTANRIIASGVGPSLTLYDTTASRPTFGIYNNNGLLSFGLATAGSGNPSGPPFLTLDQSGNAAFAARVNVTGGRLISSLNGNASITVNNTSSQAIFGFWNNTNLAFGLTDANGAPQTQLGALCDSVGNSSWNGQVASLGAANNLSSFGGPGWGISSVPNSSVVNIGSLSSGNLSSLNVYANNTFFLGQLNTTGADIISGGHVYSNAGWFHGNGWVLNGSGGSINLDNGGSANVSSIGIRGDTIYIGYGPSLIMGNGGINYGGLPGGNRVGFGWDGRAILYVDSTYNGHIQTDASDRRLKRNIAPPERDALAVIRSFALHQFDKLPQGPNPLDRDLPPPVHHDFGFIAQDLEDVIPEAVQQPPAEYPDSMLYLDMLPLVAYAWGAIQQLADRVATLEAR